MPRRFAAWPRRWVYPTIGALMSLALVAGLLTLQGWAVRQGNHPWHLTDELRRQPLVYGYLLVATLLGTSLTGWLTGRKEDLLEALSVTDPLTGLANRRRLLSAFADERNRADRYGTPLSLLLIDLDRLKQINDQRGHAEGDRALQIVAEGLQRSCRITDLPARTGGDEFVVLAVNTTATEALALAHRVCVTVRRLGIERYPDGRAGATRPTVSIGVADLDNTADSSFEGLHTAADTALYAAKAAGRDRALAAPGRDEAGSRLAIVDLRAPTFRRSPP
ncbi:MAG TPA: GGDEF domain-containing protein [Candidatus Sulfotelmatobacter sp.]|nr:GGDEF domain-containing protein [Candidatus Sulfotelmatobacter sp.]